MPYRPRRSVAGFTLIEALVVLLVLSVMLLIGVPGLLAIQQRRALQSDAESISSLLRSARYEAIRRNRSLRVAVDLGERTLFIDADDDGVLDGEEQFFGVVGLARRVELGGPAGDTSPVVGFPGASGQHFVVFTAAGNAQDAGGIRIHDDQDKNFLEIGVDRPATARVAVRKWNGSTWRERDEGGETWTWN